MNQEVKEAMKRLDRDTRIVLVDFQKQIEVGITAHKTVENVELTMKINASVDEAISHSAMLLFNQIEQERKILESERLIIRENINILKSERAALETALKRLEDYRVNGAQIKVSTGSETELPMK